MTDELRDFLAIDATALSARDLGALGDSVLGHAVRRVLAAGPASQDAGADPVAAHDSHI